MSTLGGLTGAPRRLLTLASVLQGEGVRVCVATQSGSPLIEAAEAEGYAAVAADSSGVLLLRHGALFGGGAAVPSKSARRAGVTELAIPVLGVGGAR